MTEVEENGDKVLVSSLYGDKEFAKEEILLEKCLCCKGKKHVVSDETIILHDMPETKNDRFSGVAALEAMTADERFAFWKKELSKCIRCNACRNVCPACSCVKCVFDNPASASPPRRTIRSLRNRCSISSARSMWRGAVPTAANAAASVPKTYPYIS